MEHASRNQQGIDWEKVYAIVGKEEAYKEFLKRDKQRDTDYRVNIGWLLSDEESRRAYHKELDNICGQRNILVPEKIDGRMLPKETSIPNENGKYIDCDVVSELVYDLVTYRQIIFRYEGHGSSKKKRDKVDYTLAKKPHERMLKTSQKLLKRLMEINDCADIPGIDVDLAGNLHEGIKRTYDLVKYYQHILTLGKLSGPRGNEMFNRYLLYLHLYLHFEGGYDHSVCGEVIVNLASLLDERFLEAGSEVVQDRVRRAAKVALKMRAKRRSSVNRSVDV